MAITLAELFAYAGDQLSYYQDAVANEGTLSTVRQRISAKRHAMLVDYHMHDSLAAIVILHFNVVVDTVIPYDPDNGVVVGVSTNETDPARRVIFETIESAVCRPELNAIEPWSWMGTDCCLPERGDASGSCGQFHESRRGPVAVGGGGSGSGATRGRNFTLEAEAADPSHRQIVCITSVTYLQDALAPNGPQQITRVQWDTVDALTWAPCLVAGGQTATIFRGNLVRATHGQSIFNEALDQKTFTLHSSPLTWLFAGAQTGLFPPDAVDPRNSASSVRLTVNGHRSSEEESLLNSQANDPDFVVDTNDDGAGILRFGDGQLGRGLPPNATVLATYRVGNGAAGNVGRDCLTRPVGALPAGAIAVRNPLPAWGGTDPEAIEDVPEECSTGLLRGAVSRRHSRRLCEDGGACSRSVERCRYIRLDRQLAHGVCSRSIRLADLRCRRD